MEDFILKIKENIFKLRKSKKFRKQMNLLPKNYIEEYKIKSYILKMAILWTIIFAIFITFEVKANLIYSKNINKLFQIATLSEHYVEANELALWTYNLYVHIQNSENKLLSFGSHYAIEQNIILILDAASLMNVTDISFNVNRAFVTIGIAGDVVFLPIVIDNLSNYFYNISIRSSSSHSLGVRFVIDFYIFNS